MSRFPINTGIAQPGRAAFGRPRGERVGSGRKIDASGGCRTSGEDNFNITQVALDLNALNIPNGAHCASLDFESIELTPSSDPQPPTDMSYLEGDGWEVGGKQVPARVAERAGKIIYTLYINLDALNIDSGAHCASLDFESIQQTPSPDRSLRQTSYLEGGGWEVGGKEVQAGVETRGA